MSNEITSVTDNESQQRKVAHIPFGERLTCSVDDATKVTGLGRSLIYDKMKSGEIEWVKIGKRRLIKVSSLLRFLGS
jgi:excisionase family DNA binding protein